MILIFSKKSKNVQIFSLKLEKYEIIINKPHYMLKNVIFFIFCFTVVRYTLALNGIIAP